MYYSLYSIKINLIQQGLCDFLKYRSIDRYFKNTKYWHGKKSNIDDKLLSNFKFLRFFDSFVVRFSSIFAYERYSISEEFSIYFFFILQRYFDMKCTLYRFSIYCSLFVFSSVIEARYQNFEIAQPYWQPHILFKLHSLIIYFAQLWF